MEAADVSPAPAASSEAPKQQAAPKQTKAATVLKVVKGITDAADPRPSRKIPTAEEWEPFMQKGLVYCSVFYIWWLTTDDDGNELGDTRQYELDDERASLIVPPFARVFARTGLNRRYGRDLIENFDVLVSAVAIVTYVMDTRPLWAAKRARQIARTSGNKVIPMRREQTTTAPAPVKTRPQPEKLEPVSNGGTQPQNEQPEPTANGPFKQPIGWEPGTQNRTD